LNLFGRKEEQQPVSLLFSSFLFFLIFLFVSILQMSFLERPTSSDAVVFPEGAPAIDFPFPLDWWQKQAIVASHSGKNTLITAKTGSGKTLPAEELIVAAIKAEERVLYLNPIKSLSNQKYDDMKGLLKKYGSKASVGILTGDIKSNPEADVVIMTAEILLNHLYKRETATSSLGTAGQFTLERVTAVVIDEAHYINDPERGHVWEEILILLPAHIRLMMLSATLESPELFAEWVGKARQRPIVLLQTTHRVVPLVHGIYDPMMSPLPIRTLKEGDEAPLQIEVYKAWQKDRDSRFKSHDEWKDKVRAAGKSGDIVAGSKDKVKLQSFTHTLNECVSLLAERDLLPALFFLFSRKECERNAEQIQGSLISGKTSADVRNLIRHHLHRHEELQKLPQYHQLTSLLERGIGFHHSGLLPLLKEIVELLFARGLIKVLFCTETFAVGLNMPARTVVFLDLKKPAGGGGFRPLRPDEYIQMAGRAGRRGKDTQGLVLYLPAREPVNPDELRFSMAGGLVPLTSRLQFHYNFILKAIHASKRGEDKEDRLPVWESVIQNSYWKVQSLRALELYETQVAALRTRVATTAPSEAHMRAMEEKEVLETQVRTTKHATQRRAREALATWTEAHKGSAWTTVSEKVRLYKKHAEELAAEESSLIAMRKPAETSRVSYLMKALEAWKAITLDESGVPTLTEFGTMATEANEGNPLLLAKLYESGLLKDAKPEEIVGVLATFIVDREALDKSVDPSELNITTRMASTLFQIDKWAQEGIAIDTKYGIHSPEEFWCLSTFWIGIASEWMMDATAPELLSRYEVYEGNLMKGLLKLASLVNEWITIATYKADVDMLHRLRTTPEYLLRGIAQPESLYLRL